MDAADRRSTGRTWCDGESACKRDSVGAGLTARRPVAIHLCGLPEGCPATCVVGRTGRPCPLLGLAPGGVYRAARVAPNAGALLPHRFTLTCDRSPGPSAVCSLLHLSVRSPRPGSRQHPARWSPDFPRHGRRRRRRAAATRPTHHRRGSVRLDALTRPRSAAQVGVDERVGGRGLEVDREPLPFVVRSPDDELDRRHRAERRRHRPDGRGTRAPPPGLPRRATPGSHIRRVLR